MNPSFAVAVFVLLIGLVLYLLPIEQAKVTETGRLMFFAGLLVALLRYAGEALRFG